MQKHPLQPEGFEVGVEIRVSVTVVAGDDRYGDADFNTYLKTFGLQRMFLHAHAVSFEWPETGEPFSASAPLPQDLRASLTALEVKNQSPPTDRRRAP